ncbi:hypothetical protein Q2T40_04885 [Winogradskyella maritima]|nr:hypothetical protein [Winogradskyella maritima]
MTHETLKAGEQNQIVLRKNQTSFPDFRIRNIAVNGKVWTGEKNTTFSVFQEGNYPGKIR